MRHANAAGTWLDTWELRFLILAVVAATVLFVAYFSQAGRL